MIFAYMGKDEPPEFPDYELHRGGAGAAVGSAVDDQLQLLQALEGGYDPAHLSFLHRPTETTKTRDRFPGRTKHVGRHVLRRRSPPESGLRGDRLRRAHLLDSQIWRRQEICARDQFRHAQPSRSSATKDASAKDIRCIGMCRSTTRIMCASTLFLTASDRWTRKIRARFGNRTGPDGVTNRSVIIATSRSASRCRRENFTGMGKSFNVHDAFACESMGPIRTGPRNISRRPTASSCGCAASSWKRSRMYTRQGAARRGRDPHNSDSSHMVVVSEVLPKAVDFKRAWMNRIVQKTAAE